MIITCYFPAPPLSSFIKSLWYCEGPARYSRLKVLPMPSLHLMVNFGDPFHVYKAAGDGPFATCGESWSLGLWSAYHIMDWPAEMNLLNVSFKPGGAYPFLRLPLSELNNHAVSLDA